MKRLLFALFTLLMPLVLQAQKDSTPFRAYLYNNEFKVFMRINFESNDLIIPGQDLLGPLSGYLGKDGYSFYWPIISAEVKGKKAHLQMVNDYGSEDLEAELIRQNDSTYVLRQGKGSSLKVPDGGKWQKLPNVLTFKRMEK